MSVHPRIGHPPGTQLSLTPALTPSVSPVHYPSTVPAQSAIHHRAQAVTQHRPPSASLGLLPRTRPSALRLSPHFLFSARHLECFFFLTVRVKLCSSPLSSPLATENFAENRNPSHGRGGGGGPGPGAGVPWGAVRRGLTLHCPAFAWSFPPRGLRGTPRPFFRALPPSLGLLSDAASLKKPWALPLFSVGAAGALP